MLGQEVLVLGSGISGNAMARWCHHAGAKVTVVDSRDNPPNKEGLASLEPTIEVITNSFNPELLLIADFKYLLISPGLSPEQIGSLKEAAINKGITVWGELNLFQHALLQLQQEQSYAPKILAITGTNGKTTVTSLTGLLVARSGQTVCVAGNIGPSMLDCLLGHLQANTLPEVWVLELSSFQLETAPEFSPTCATVLNISQDHLDWHGSMQAYQDAKGHIFGQNTIKVLNRDDPLVMAYLRQDFSLTRSKKTSVKEAPVLAYISFGSDSPTRIGDFGIETVNGMSWLVQAQTTELAPQLKRGKEVLETEFVLQKLMPTEALRIRGRHNVLNALAALCLMQSVSTTMAPILYGLREYKGEPHRVEPINIIREVEYFDDSKGTNVGATVAAIEGLGPERKLVIILGGDGKGQDFSPLIQPLAKYARAVILIGKDGPTIGQVLGQTNYPVLAATDLSQAVQIAAKQALSNDAVLLSPACASLDMFKNYAHRAEVFIQAVTELEHEIPEGADYA
jgi:UDP-N-acetylmuramoylalanine--D-glutamate ligase